MARFTMPSLGADMEAGRLVEWHVKPGDKVARGDVVAVVETQKGAIEIEIFMQGVVERLDAALGDTVLVGAPLATIREAGAVPAAPVAATEPAASVAPGPVSAALPQQAAAEAPAAAQPVPLAGVAAGPAVRGAAAASPAARLLARERGIDLETLSGSGPQGAVLLADVAAAMAAGAAPASAPTPAPTPPARKPGLDPAAMRLAIAAAMARSKREIPHYYLSQTIDLQPAADWLSAVNASRPPDARLLMGALFVRAAARAAAAVPEMNGHFSDGTFRPASAVHAGVAVALRGGGLIAPAIHDAQSMSPEQLMAGMRELVARARSGRLRSSEMTDGTITVSSMGDSGADSLTGVIYPPQVALVGFGAPQRRPWIIGEAIVPRLVVTVTLSADHRVSDGRRGARFLAELDRHLQNPGAS